MKSTQSHLQELKNLLSLLKSMEQYPSTYAKTETEILIDTVKNSALLIALALISTRAEKGTGDV